MLLIAGGEQDPNLLALMTAAQRLAVDTVDARVASTVSPDFYWDLSTGQHSYPQGIAGAFLRQDVFAALHDPRPEVAQRAAAWFTTLQGWLLTQPQIKRLNQHIQPIAFNKPAALYRAQQVGLQIPTTRISNSRARLPLAHADQWIAKLVTGGGYCAGLDEAFADVEQAYAAQPAIVQQRLVSPEMRVFVIGDQAFAFELISPSLDYRVTQDAALRQIPAPPQEETLLRQLMSQFGMDFGAADFKTDPHTGAWVFLELNTSPMFARFDQVSAGALCEQMVRSLITP